MTNDQASMTNDTGSLPFLDAAMFIGHWDLDIGHLYNWSLVSRSLPPSLPQRTKGVLAAHCNGRRRGVLAMGALRTWSGISLRLFVWGPLADGRGKFRSKLS